MSIDSGVVICDFSNLTPVYKSIDEISPTFDLTYSSKILWIIYVTVVFPFVPVTPILFNFLSGLL